MLLRPLFFTSWLIDDFLRDSDMFGAGTVVLSSASSKTASGLAFLLSPRRRRRRGRPHLGARRASTPLDSGSTTPSSPTRSSRTLPAGRAVYVDMSGDAAVREGVHRRYGAELVALGRRRRHPSRPDGRGSRRPARARGRPSSSPPTASPSARASGAASSSNSGSPQAWEPYVTWTDGWLEVIHEAGARVPALDLPGSARRAHRPGARARPLAPALDRPAERPSGSFELPPPPGSPTCRQSGEGASQETADADAIRRPTPPHDDPLGRVRMRARARPGSRRREAERRTGAVRPRLHGAGRRALLPHRQPRRTRAQLRRRAARRRRHAARQRQRAVPHDRDDARLGRRARRRSSRARPQATATRRSTTTTSTTPSTATRSSTTPRAAGATPAGRRNRARKPPAAKKAGSGSPTSATRRATRSTCSACWPTRTSPSRSRSASPGISYGGGQSIELAYLKNRIRLPERRIRAVDEPRREDDGSQGRVPALAVVGPGRRAGAERALPRHRNRARRTRAANRSASRSRATSPGLYADGQPQRLHRAARRRPRSRPDEVVRG